MAATISATRTHVATNNLPQIQCDFNTARRFRTAVVTYRHLLLDGEELTGREFVLRILDTRRASPSVRDMVTAILDVMGRD